MTYGQAPPTSNTDGATHSAFTYMHTHTHTSGGTHARTYIAALTHDPCKLTLAASAFAHPDSKLTASLTDDLRSSSSISLDCMSSAAFSSFEDSGITSE